MRTLAGLLLALFALAVLASLVVFSGAYNVAADEPHWALTVRLLEAARTQSIEARARGLKAPDLQDEKRIRRGAAEYAEMCESCHLAPGAKETALRQGLNPRPPDFTRRRDDMDARADFWVIKHGIKMTGMPAWGVSHGDEALWDLAAFVRRLPSLDPASYAAMVRKAQVREKDETR